MMARQPLVGTLAKRLLGYSDGATEKPYTLMGDSHQSDLDETNLITNDLRHDCSDRAEARCQCRGMHLRAFSSCLRYCSNESRTRKLEKYALEIIRYLG